MKNKENEDKKDSKISKEISSTNSKILILEIFLKVFVLIAGILAFTMYFYFKTNNYYEEEISMTRDIHHLKAYFKGYNNHLSIKGHVEITEIHEGLNIQGRIEGLNKGSIHGVHVLQYSDITDLERNIASDDVLKHFNPKNKAHSCPSTSNYDDENFHFGDFGNVIANQDGIAFISIIKKIPLRSLNGRIIVILANEDKCDSNQEIDNPINLIGYGLLNAYKPKIIMGVDRTNEYFLREINFVNKKEFDKKNIIYEPHANKIRDKVDKIKTNTNQINKEHIPVLKHQILTNNKDKSISKIEHHSTLENITKTDKKEIKNLNVLNSVEQEDNGRIVNENKNLENFLNESEIKLKKSSPTYPYFLTDPIINKSEDIKAKSKTSARNKYFSSPLLSKKLNENKKEKVDKEIINDLSSNNISSELKNDNVEEPLISKKIKENKDPMFDDVPHKINLFEDLFKNEEQTKYIEQPKVEKEIHKPVFANKNEEPHFIHINNKISNRDRREIPFFLRSSKDMNLNPFINSEHQSSHKKIESKAIIDQPYNKDKFMKEEFNKNIPKNKNQQPPIQQTNFEFDDFFRNLFKDKDEINVSNNKILFPITQSPLINTDEKQKENNKSNLDSFLKMTSVQPKLDIDKDKQEKFSTKNEKEIHLNSSNKMNDLADGFNRMGKEGLESSQEFPSPLDHEIVTIPANEKSSIRPLSDNVFSRPKKEFSFMAPNIEPFVHTLMKNATSSKLVKYLDQDLLNPYKDRIIQKDPDLNMDLLMKKFDINLNNQEEYQINKSDKFENGLNVINKFNHLNEIIKNKTITEIKKYKTKEENLQNFSISNKKARDKFGKNEKLENILQKEMNVIKKFNPYENFKLLKFKENQKSVERKLLDIPQKLSNIPILNKALNEDHSRISPHRISSGKENSVKAHEQDKNQSQSGEISSKMLENITKEENKIKHLNLHDEDKLFIKDIKNNIDKLDKISNKFKSN